MTSATVAATLTNIAISVAINFALARLNRPRAPRPQDQQSEIRQSDADRMRHYGRVRASGVVHFWDWATENDQRYLYKQKLLNLKMWL
ncbi:MAG: hypothetical protein ACPGFC_08970 [Paracoccaceae bacterium]